jgi:hypothetical protein
LVLLGLKNKMQVVHHIIALLVAHKHQPTQTFVQKHPTESAESITIAVIFPKVPKPKVRQNRYLLDLLCQPSLSQEAKATPHIKLVCSRS